MGFMACVLNFVLILLKVRNQPLPPNRALDQEFDCQKLRCWAYVGSVIGITIQPRGEVDYLGSIVVVQQTSVSAGINIDNLISSIGYETRW